MTNSLWYSFREGDHSEYLAQYFLSALGISVPVQRQEDIGVDFYCSLARRGGQRLTFYDPFIVQTKSAPPGEISYGGPDKNGVWRRWEVEWLFEQELPLIIGIVDKAQLRVDLYSTANMWWTHYKHGGSLGQVVLRPNVPEESGAEISGAKDTTPSEWPAGIGNGRCYQIPLGPPMVSMGIHDVDDEAKLEAYRALLSHAVGIDQQNITYRRLHAHYHQWLVQIETNKLEPGTPLGVSYAWSGTPGTHTKEQLESVAPLIHSLANNFKAQCKTEELLRLKGIMELIPDRVVPGVIKSNLPELFGDGKEDNERIGEGEA